MKPLFFLLPALLLLACDPKEKADTIVYNTNVYTVDEEFNEVEAFAVRNGEIIAVGSTSDILGAYEAFEMLDLEGLYVYPGFIDAHAHFLGYGLSLQSADLRNTGSWEEVIERLKEFALTRPEGWLTGRGWDQNDWATRQFPDNSLLNAAFPAQPVLLKRIDGHAAIANQAALTLAGIRPGDTISGGRIETLNGRLTGLLIDNAVDRVAAMIPAPDFNQKMQALLDAQQRCFEYGLTTVTDCGVNYQDLMVMDSLHRAETLKMRIYAMLSDSPANYRYLLSKGMIKTPRLHVRAFKVYSDGALGSRGACLLHPYSDDSSNRGFLLSNPAHFDAVARLIYENQFQMCTHAIGDSANRLILQVYGKYLKGKNDRRWRIEHAQVVNQRDFDLFGRFGIVPSVQPTHATSDMTWAIHRLGKDRVQGAYAYKSLLAQNGWLPLGTDFPVEDISPLRTFHSAVYRSNEQGLPAKGYQPSQSLTPEQALRGMTIWAARASFEEKEKGSIEKGKRADFVVLEKDLMKAPADSIVKMRAYMTYVDGERVY